MLPMQRYLRAWRDFRDLSQEHVANILQTDRSSLSRWENEKVPLTTEQMQELALIYKATPAQLLAHPDDAQLVDRLMQIQAIIDGMPEASLQHWMAIGQALKHQL